MAAMTKEEHARNQRRRARQLFGAFLVVMVLIGLFTVVRGAVGAIGGLFDKTDEYASYEKKLEGFVLFDPLPFDGIENMNDTTLREAAVWGTVYGILDTENGASLRAAGWKCVGQAGGLRWTGKRRPEVDLYPAQMKIRWEREAENG